MEIVLQCPIKMGTTRTGWHHELKSLDDFKRCIFQGFGDKLIDYSFMGLVAHNGRDIGLENGDEVFASHDGTANFQEDSKKGLGVVITTQGYKTIYWHLKDCVQPLNSTWQVKKGDLIGHGDSTGFSTGPHLHYGLKLLDSNGNVLNRDNGYDGAVSLIEHVVWWDTMNDVEVRKLYRLAFYREPDAGELAFWSGRSLAEFLTVALKDRAEFLSSPL